MRRKRFALPSLFLYVIFLGVVTPTASSAAESFTILNSSLKMIWGLLVVLGILLIIYGLVKKRVNLLHGGGKGEIKVIETRHLMPKKSLFLIEVRGQEFLIGSGSDSLSLIAPLNDPIAPTSFDSILKDSEKAV